MEKQTFFAKVDSINETTYETNTLSVLTKDNERLTLRIDENIKLSLNSVYSFTVEPIEFKEKRQYLVHDYVAIEETDISLGEKQTLMETFYEYAPVSMDAIQANVESHLAQIKNDIIKAIVMELYNHDKQAFYLYPAATKFHHAYIGGLSYHTSTMFDLMDGFCNTYPFLNKDLMIAGIFLHDIEKVRELSNYAGPEYTKEGRLLGHITMGVKKLELVAHSLGYLETEEVLLLQHMILSHHYFGNFGSPKKPMIPEALALHFMDNIDSKMTVLMETLETVEPGEFTPPISVIDREKFYKSKL